MINFIGVELKRLIPTYNMSVKSHLNLFILSIYHMVYTFEVFN